MNFIEALKANETEVVIMFDGPCDGEPFMIGQLKLASYPFNWMYSKKFRPAPKPRVVEFECLWTQNQVIHPHEAIDSGINLRDKLLPMINGKRWRVRCEEIL